MTATTDPMTQATSRGWYPDPIDPHTARFWTGTQWMGERVWDGSAWVERPEPEGLPVPPARPADTMAQVPSSAQTFATQVAQALDTFRTQGRRSPMLFLVGGGGITAVISTFLPWFRVSESALGVTMASSVKMTGIGVFIVMALAAAATAAAWPTVTRRTTALLRSVGIAVAAGLMSLLVPLGWAVTGHKYQGMHLGPEAGLALFVAGVVAVWAGAAYSLLTELDRKRN